MNFIIWQNATHAKSVAAFAVILALGACEATMPVSQSSTGLASDRTAIQNYSVGDSASAKVGQAMINKGSQVYVEISSEQLTATTDLESGGFKVERGKQYPVMSHDGSNGGYVIAGEGRSVAVRVDKEGRLLQPTLLYLRQGEWKENTIFNAGEPGTAIFEGVETERRLAPESARTELLYTGLSGDTVEMTYREFKGANEEPTVSEDYSFKLAEHDMIRVRNFRIKVESVNSGEIKYSVLTD